MPAASRLLINLRSTLNRIIVLQCELTSARLICNGEVYFTHVKIVGGLIVKKLVLRNVSCLPAKLCLPPRTLSLFRRRTSAKSSSAPTSQSLIHSLPPFDLSSNIGGSPPLHVPACSSFMQLLDASYPSFLTSKSGVNTSSILHQRYDGLEDGTKHICDPRR
jgi:hypothetical protein